MHFIHRILAFLILPIVCGLIVLLERRFPIGVAVAIYAGAVVLATLTAAILLRSSAIGQSSWRTMLATKLLPWSWIGGYGSLLKLCMFNLLGSAILGVLCFAAARFLRHSDYSPAHFGIWTIACAPAWIVLIGMVLFLLRQYGKNYYAGPSGLRHVLKLMAAPAGALAASIALVATGLPFVGFVVAMIPIAVVFVPIAFLLMIAVGTKLSGKPLRWH